MRKNKTTLKLIDLEPTNQSLIFYCAKDTKDFHSELNKKENKHISNWLKGWTRTIEMPDDDSNGFVLFHKETQKPFILYIRKRKRDWWLYETIVHEVTHLTDRLSNFCQFNNESEFRAYMAESLFRKIRRLV